jgi:DNA mismatch repair protein MSH6
VIIVIRSVDRRDLTIDADTDDLIPVQGKDEEYDENREEIEGLEADLNKQLKKLEKLVECVISRLEQRTMLTRTSEPLTYWHSHLGTKDIYLVQIKAGEKVPRDWLKSGGTKAVVRYTVPALATLIRSLKEARERKDGIMKSFKFRVYAEFDRDRGTWLRAVRVLAELDCLLGLAKASLALGEPACRPEFVDDDAAWVDFEELTHPVLAARSKSAFIPNDVALGGEKGRIALLTGPNMGGKSTVMRMTATGVVSSPLS